MKRMPNIVVSLLYVMALTLMPCGAQAKVDWEVFSAIQLDATPLDVANSPDGELTFLLTDEAKVLIYSSEGKLVGTVPVDPSVTDIDISPKGEKLYLINSKRKTLLTINVDFVVDINVSDSPFLGPAGAEVVVAVFSDFQ